MQYSGLLTFPRQMAVSVCADNEAYSVLSSSKDPLELNCTILKLAG